MAQSSVAREPSMEEILASIRRIIESNDPVGKEPARAPAYAGDDDMAESEIDAEDAREIAFMLEAANDKAPPVAEMRHDLRMPAPAPDSLTEARPELKMGQPLGDPRMAAPEAPASADPSRPAAKSISLADLAARVRAAADRGEGMGMRPAIQPQEPVENPVMTSRMADLRRPPETAAAVEQPMVRPDPPMRQPALQAQPPQAQEPVSGYQAMGAELQAALDSAARQSPSAALREPMAKAVVVPMPEPEEPSRGLISVMAGEQIARSFDELAAAIDGTQRRSLDEMAEEMLRPMLQEWLDDNLPTLVERLVREEIERVARGPRR